MGKIKDLFVVIVIVLMSSIGFAQTDSVEVKLVNKYNELAKQLEQLVEQKGLLEGYMTQKAEFLKEYGMIDSASLANNLELKKKVTEYQTLEDNYKKVSEAIPQTKGKMQAIIEEINAIRDKKKNKDNK